MGAYEDFSYRRGYSWGRLRGWCEVAAIAAALHWGGDVLDLFVYIWSILPMEVSA